MNSTEDFLSENVYFNDITPTLKDLFTAHNIFRKMSDKFLFEFSVSIDH